MPKVNEKKIDAPKPVEAPKPEKKGVLVAYAEFAGHQIGDVFHIPAGWQRDINYEDLILNKSKRREGMVFIAPNGARVVLPVKEA